MSAWSEVEEKDRSVPNKAEGRSHVVTVLSEVEPVWSQEMRDNAGLKSCTI